MEVGDLAVFKQHKDVFEELWGQPIILLDKIANGLWNCYFIPGNFEWIAKLQNRLIIDERFLSPLTIP